MALQIFFNPLSGQFDFVGSGSTPTPSPRYSATFNNTTDWTLSSPDYVHSVLAATHGLGTRPSVKVFESLGGGSYEEVIVNVSINSSGDVSLKVSQLPNNRFTGLILIL